MPSIKSIPITLVNALVALWITVFANYTFLHSFIVFDGKTGIVKYLLLIATATILWALFNLIIQWLTWGKAAKPVLIVLLIISSLTAYCVDSFGVGIDTGQIQNLLHTDTHEATDLMGVTFWMYFVLIGILPSIFVWRVRIKPNSLLKNLVQRSIACIAGFALLVVAALSFYVDYAAVFREHRDLNFKITPTNALYSLALYGLQNIDFKEKSLQKYGEDAKFIPLQADSKPTLMVVVIGETARAQSFSLNGYSKPTNEKLAQQPIINFSNVSSCGTATAVSLPCMFSGMTRQNYDGKLAKHREGLLDIIQRAGYHVTWIENQMGCKKTCDRVETINTDKSNSQYCIGGECHDGLAFDRLAQFLKESQPVNRVVVVHMMGSHGPAYYNRYPAAFEKFKPTCQTNNIQSCTQAQIINTYDNTIVYTDDVLSRTLDLVKSYAPQYEGTLLYVSDHGESTGENGLYLHGAPYMIAPSQQTHVPMIAWLSDAYKNSHPSQTACLLKHKDAALAHDNLFHTALGMLNINTHVYNAQLDVSACP